MRTEVEREGKEVTEGDVKVEAEVDVGGTRLREIERSLRMETGGGYI